MVEYYFITSILVFINLIILIFKFEGKQIIYYLTLLGLLMTVSCSGYLALALSTNISEAILAKKIYYIGGCFVPPVVFFAVCALCNFKVAGWLRNLLYVYSFLVYGMVLTIGYNDLYYINIYMDKYRDVTVLKYEYGIGHIFFDLLLYGYMIVGLVLLIYSLYKKYAVSRKNLWAFIMLECANIVLFVATRSLDSEFEIMPLMYVIDSWIFLYMHKRATMYNIEDNIISSLGKQETYGYIMFDNHMNYLGCNDIAQMIIPEIAQCKVDLQIKNNPKMENVLQWIKDYSENVSDSFSYEAKDKHYHCSIERLRYKEKASGYIIEMREDTDRWNYLNLLSSYNSDLERQVEEKTEHITNIQSQVLVGMADMVENRDDSTGDILNVPVM